MNTKSTFCLAFFLSIFLISHAAKDTLVIHSENDYLCKGAMGIFTTNHSGKVLWEVFTKNGESVFISKTDTLFWSTNTATEYRITATHSRYAAANFAVSVKENPPALTTTNGSHEVCRGEALLLSAHPTSSNYYIHWEPTCPSSYSKASDGDDYTVFFGNTICDVEVYQIDKEYGCQSDPLIHKVAVFNLAPLSLAPLTTVNAGSTITLSVPNQSATVTYKWTIAPSNAASVIGDHLSSTVHILTNHLTNDSAPYIYVKLLRKYCIRAEKQEIIQLFIQDTITAISKTVQQLPSDDSVAPSFDLSYDCNGHFVITDRSTYPKGSRVPDRTFTVIGTTLKQKLSYPDTVTTISTQGLAAGTYQVRMGVADSRATVTRSLSIEPDPVIDSVICRNFMCDETPALFSAKVRGDVTNYHWDFGDGAFNYGNNIYHTYGQTLVSFKAVLTVTNSHGCTASAHKYIIVRKNEFVGTLTSIHPKAYCPGDSIYIRYSPYSYSSTYTWNPGNITNNKSMFMVNKTGDYRVHIESMPYGCKTEEMCRIYCFNNPVARISGDTIYHVGEKVKLFGNSGNANSYTWEITGPEIHTFNTANIKFTPMQAGQYTTVLTVSNADGCSASDTASIIVIKKNY